MQRKRYQFLGTLTAAGLLIFFSALGWLKAPEAWLAKKLAPLEAVFYNWGLNLSAFKNYQAVQAENLRLKNELSAVDLDYLKLNDLLVENQYLKNELGFLKQAKYSFKLAPVIGRLFLNDNVFIIGLGADSGLRSGLAVTVNQGIIIGKISQVEQNRSLVRLLNDTGSQLAVSIGNQSGSTNGLLTGQAGNSLLVELIPQSEPVAQGQTVVTSGLEELVPRGLLVGSVSQVEQRLGDIFKQARISPPFSYNNLNILTVILNE